MQNKMYEDIMELYNLYMNDRNVQRGILSDKWQRIIWQYFNLDNLSKEEISNLRYVVYITLSRENLIRMVNNEQSFISMDAESAIVMAIDCYNERRVH